MEVSEICPPPVLSHSLCGRQQGQIQALSAWKCRKSARPLSSLIVSAAVNRGRSRRCRHGSVGKLPAPLSSLIVSAAVNGQIQALSAWKCRKSARPLSSLIASAAVNRGRSRRCWRGSFGNLPAPLSSLIASAAVNRGRSRLCRRFVTKIWD